MSSSFYARKRARKNWMPTIREQRKQNILAPYSGYQGQQQDGDMSQRILSRAGCVGAPISCLSLPNENFCIYALGSFLVRDAITCDDPSSEQLCVWETGDNIHGVCHDISLYSAIYGGRKIAFLENLVDATLPLRVLDIVASMEENENVLTLDDWIWDVRVTTSSMNPADSILIAGLAHNTLKIFNVSRIIQGGIQTHCLHTIRGSTRCITYSLSLGPCRKVAVGTVMHEILVWSIPELSSLNDDVSVDETLKLVGHQGAIHHVQFDEDSETCLASISDDRSVRLWDNGKLKWTAWGHTARCWKVAFAPQGIWSTGEDGTARLWERNTGAPLLILRGHEALCIWSIAIFRSLVATGAHNGTVALYRVQDRLFHQRQAGTSVGNGSWRCTFPVPNDRCSETKDYVNIQELIISNDDSSRKGKKKNNKILQQVIFGMKMYRSTCDSSPTLVVATREGSLMTLDTVQGSWRTLQPWWNLTLLEKYGIHASDGCCIDVSPFDTHFLLIGTLNGKIIVLFDWLTSLNRSIRIFDASESKAVQKISWIDKANFLSYHVKSLHWWRIDSSDSNKDTVDSIRLVTDSKGIPCCHAYNEKAKHLVIGDSRGTLILFGMNDAIQGSFLSPLSILPKAHKKEHVNGIVWKDTNRLASVGNDACLLETYVSKSGGLQSLLSTPIATFTGITRLWLDSRSSLFVAGFFGNEFKVIDIVNRYEYFRYNTGGRQRIHELSIDDCRACNPLLFYFAVCRSEINGFNAIDFVAQIGDHDEQTAIRSSLGVCGHHETIFDACMFKVPDRDCLALLTASEDCSARVTVWSGSGVHYAMKLPPHETGVRAVCSSRLSQDSNATFVAVAGGKLIVHFYLVDENIQAKSLGYGKSRDEPCIDHRINCIRATPFILRDKKVHLVSTGDSNGDIYLFQVTEKDEGKYNGFHLYSNNRPIFCMDSSLVHGSTCLVLGDSSGDVFLFLLPQMGSSEEPWLKFSSLSPIHRIKLHSTAVNSLSLLSKPGKLLICTGGDDQAISSIEMSVVFDNQSNNGHVKDVYVCFLANVCVSASRGVQWINSEYFAVSGYDQKVRIIERLPQNRIIETDSIPINVGDVNCLAFHTLNDVRWLAVAGLGIDFVSVDVSANGRHAGKVEKTDSRK